jgi:hypothetical protein
MAAAPGRTILAVMPVDPAPEVDDERDPLPSHAAAVVGRLVPQAFGVAGGLVAGLGLFFVTIVPALRGEPHLADHVGLLSQYLYGFTVTVPGAVIALGYGLVGGYLVGALFAGVRNFAVGLYLRFVWRRAEHHAASDLLDRL